MCAEFCESKLACVLHIAVGMTTKINNIMKVDGQSHVTHMEAVEQLRIPVWTLNNITVNKETHTSAMYLFSQAEKCSNF
jgi:hypothetical protein